MWKTRDPSGRIRYNEKFEDPYTGKQRTVSVAFDKDNNANMKKAYKILIDKINKKSCNADTLTFGEVVDNYRDYQSHTVSDSTYTRNYCTMKTLLNILGSDILISKMSARYIKQKLLETGKKIGTLNEYIHRLKSMLKWAYKEGLISSNRICEQLDPFQDVPHKAKIAEKYLESYELKAVLVCMNVPIWKYLTQFMVLSGLRFGEACALEKNDIGRTTIHITKSYNSVSEKVVPAKTINSIGDVAIQKELRECINKINELMRKQEKDYHYVTNLFFSDTQGHHINYYAFNKYFKENTLAVVGRPLTTHSLRHTHASLLFEQGFTLEEVSRRLRHGNSKITEEVYIHITDKLKQKDAEHIRNIRLI